jgi:hypothetical protein
MNINANRFHLVKVRSDGKYASEDAFSLQRAVNEYSFWSEHGSDSKEYKDLSAIAYMSPKKKNVRFFSLMEAERILKLKRL